ncbi:hypothetical protein CONLIGDRAFT_163122 [Coniochaeta ligniaria NRRL 30616]|uniref:Uncharacterized protein n=1 Tax=Coniochaeta ligniaria NRRL 30616 TaxID=1408157 RepID=A0A1J7IZE0_9PEZI|nr:hypothetical protein CONLIGDRAFT_163122 [Coniochaeta ligniaria NRRL 30616]
MATTLLQNAPRYLTLDAAKAVWDKNPKKGQRSAFKRTAPKGMAVDDDPEPSDLPTGFELLHSFYAPSLTASSSAPTNTITITQTVESSGQTLTLSSNQDFTVVAPQFSLPDGDVHSTYPSQGSTAAAAILPHVVFSDPHLPWEREVVALAKEKEPGRNKTPWLALMAFTADEILLPPDELAGSKRIFAADTWQSSTLSITQKISDLRTILPENARNCVPADADGTTVADFLFMTPQIFNSYFALDPTKDGQPAQTSPDLSAYRFLAHSRAINTAGMANAGIQDDGLYSVIVSRRCGLWTNTTPVPIYVHLVSLDQADTLGPWPMSGTKHVALCSLYSWTYRCLPPESVDIADGLRDLALTKDVLGPTSDIYSSWIEDKDQVKQLLGGRLKDGFSLSRYLVQTGEETAAFYRGPCTPTTVKSPLTEKFTMQSTYSSDLQILDHTLGIMDITYSTAWQLGRSLGLADQAFFNALGRLRTAISSTGLDSAKRTILGDAHVTSADVAARLPQSFKKLQTVISHHVASPKGRWHRPRSRGTDLSLWSSPMQEAFAKASGDAAMAFAMDSTGEVFYNELNKAASPDYAVVLKWVLDRKFLFGIPAHYLISDATYLPPETLRYFQIDQNWVDALIDGALSLANHAEQDNDTVRKAIKDAINAYLSKEDPVLKYKPQVPIYGFFLRSDIVTQFPDLKVDIPYTTTTDPRAPLLRHENVDEGVMLVLLDRVPADSELTQMTLTQPPHQQRFAAAATVGIELGANPPVTDPTFEVEHKSIFTVPNPTVPQMQAPCGPDATWTQGGSKPNPDGPAVFNFDTRMVYANNFAEHIFANLIKNMPKGMFVDTVPTAAMAAIQLNDPVYSLTIDFPKPPPAVSSDVLRTKAPAKGTSPVDGRLNMTGLANRSGVDRLYSRWVASQQKRASAARSSITAIPSSGYPAGSSYQQAARPRSSLPPPPHYRPIPSGQGSKSPRRPGGEPGDDDPSDHPKFKYAIYPITDIGGPIPTQSPIAQDLVVSVVLPPNQRNLGRFELQELLIVLPWGKPGGGPDDRINLFTNYRGGGPVMLSNLRFNVEASFQTDTMEDDGLPVMWLRILPRKVNGLISTKYIDEMSIILPEVDVNPYKAKESFMQVKIYEYYDPDVWSQPFTSSITVTLAGPGS